MVGKHSWRNRGPLGKRWPFGMETVTVAVGMSVAGGISSTERAGSMKESCAPKNETPSMRWPRRSTAAVRSWMRIICSGQRTVWSFRWRI